jgi:Protein of unknown function (DUF2844)
MRSHVAWLCGALLCFAAKDADATLGGDLASIASNARALVATRTLVPLASVARHDLTLPSGNVVSEYVSGKGVVFAIRWHGPLAPNLRELLGEHFEDLAKKNPSAGHHSLHLSLSDFEVRSSNHRGTFEGVAWVPSLVPQDAPAEVWTGP